jgi:hypothetical protein
LFIPLDFSPSTIVMYMQITPAVSIIIIISCLTILASIRPTIHCTSPLQMGLLSPPANFLQPRFPEWSSRKRFDSLFRPSTWLRHSSQIVR